jgi:olefin beta-lactone synthetase
VDRDDLARATLPPDSPGEIIVCGDHVLTGYLDGRGDSGTKIQVDGRVWHRTGDAGRRDAAGRLWLLGRCAAKVDDAEGRVYPFAVECAASGVEGLRRCAFVRHHGARVLVVELEPGAGRAAIVAGVRECVGWARLADVLVVPRIPVDGRHNAKVDYPALARLLR